MHIRRIYICLYLLLAFLDCNAGINPDDTHAGKELLNQERKKIPDLKSQEEKVQRMMDLGLWTEAKSMIGTFRNNNSTKLLKARWLFLENQFKSSSLLVDSVLEGNRNNLNALELKAELLLEAWKLKSAEEILLELKGKNPKLSRPRYLLGFTYLLEGKNKDLDQNLKELKTEFPDQAWYELLSGRDDLIKNEPGKADSVFKQGLSKDPLNADLRFYYGYTQWRNAKGNFLDRMTDQWDLCLDINPLHYLAHWHLGNGHTSYTYQDYASKEDSLVLRSLIGFDLAIGQKKYQEAIQIAESGHKKFPQSLIPLIYKASAFYMSPEKNGQSSLDSAQAIFIQALKKKKDYGPAENGLASVIKAKRIPFLYFYDSITTKLKDIKISELLDLEAVIPETKYFPETIARMAKMELFSANAYLPLLKKGGYAFHILPLHHTLAETFHDAYFNQATTFDYRKWMDIRGVGSGAVGLEYVEKGAFLERNVLLHEYIHLIHSQFTTEKDKRRIRALYLDAVKKGHALDYYAAGNEQEYFAQIYPAYFATKAVQPQDFKSLNTQALLKSKDPEAYRFMDSLVKAENQFVQGNANIFRDEFCELYINLSQNAQNNNGNRFTKAKAYLDTASLYDADYLPLLMAKADLGLKMGDQEIADQNIKKASALDPKYSPAFEKNYELNRSLEAAGLLDYNTAYELEKSDLLKAIDLESDPVIQADHREALVDLYRSNSLIPDEVQAREDLYKNIATYSSNEKTRKNLILGDKIIQSLELGYPESLDPLEKIYQTNPQDYEFALKYAQSLENNGNKEKATAILEKSLELQKPSGRINPEQALYLAVFQGTSGNQSRGKEILKTVLKNQVDSSFLMVQAYLATGQTEKAENLFKAFKLPHDFFPKSEYYSIKGDLRIQENNLEEGVTAYQDALANNPYNFRTAKKLIEILKKLNRPTAIQAIMAKLASLPVKPGPMLGITAN